MLYTYLTTSWHLRYSIIGAPMAGVAGGRLARAVSQAGGLGMTEHLLSTTIRQIEFELEKAENGLCHAL